MKGLSVGYTEALVESAKLLANRLNLPLDNQSYPQLCVTRDGIVLLIEGFSPLFVDFRPRAWQKRRNAGKTQGLIKACKPMKGLRILDATAGWGRDAVLLASFGASVTMAERNPVMQTLLTDALSRLQADSPLSRLLSLVEEDAKVFIHGLAAADYPDVIYIDPMHPERQKSALVKKDMQTLQHLIGTDEDAEELISLALSRINQRVVVKWPQRLPPVRKPSISYEGKTVRFDVFLKGK